jgi:hypothetical protein
MEQIGSNSKASNFIRKITGLNLGRDSGGHNFSVIYLSPSGQILR